MCRIAESDDNKIEITFSIQVNDNVENRYYNIKNKSRAIFQTTLPMMRKLWNIAKRSIWKYEKNIDVTNMDAGKYKHEIRSGRNVNCNVYPMPRVISWLAV